MTTSDSINWGMSPTLTPEQSRAAVERNPCWALMARDRAERQAAVPPPKIATFQGQYSFLDLYWAAPVTDHYGRAYPTIGHAYQCMKTLDPGWRKRIMNTPDAEQVEHLGRTCPLRPGWNAISRGVMLALTRAKYNQHAELATKLKATNPAELIDGNTRHNVFWGICTCPTHYGTGQNLHGLTLVQVRAELLHA